MRLSLALAVPLLVALVLALAAGGCTAQLTQAGREVRLVEGTGVSRCTRLGPVEATGGNGASVDENERTATHLLRNRVAKLGGNAYAVTGRTVHPWGTVVQGDAYRCPLWEPVPGLEPRPR